MALVLLPLLLAPACGRNGYDCSQEEYDRFEQKHAEEGMTSEVEECGDRFE